MGSRDPPGPPGRTRLGPGPGSAGGPGGAGSAPGAAPRYKRGRRDGATAASDRTRGATRLSECVRGSEAAGGMRGPAVSLCALLCLAVAVGGGRPVRLERVRADARALTRTLSTRLQQLQLFPLTLRISGLEGVPEGALPDGGPPPGLGWAAQRLQLFQRLLAALPGPDLRLAQVSNDLENLRSLLAVLGALLGCPAPPAPPPAPPAPHAEAPHTLAGVALARLRACLDGVAARLEGVPAC